MDHVIYGPISHCEKVAWQLLSGWWQGVGIGSGFGECRNAKCEAKLRMWGSRRRKITRDLSMAVCHLHPCNVCLHLKHLDMRALLTLCHHTAAMYSQSKQVAVPRCPWLADGSAPLSLASWWLCPAVLVMSGDRWLCPNAVCRPTALPMVGIAHYLKSKMNGGIAHGERPSSKSSKLGRLSRLSYLVKAMDGHAPPYKPMVSTKTWDTLAWLSIARCCVDTYLDDDWIRSFFRRRRTLAWLSIARCCVDTYLDDDWIRSFFHRRRKLLEEAGGSAPPEEAGGNAPPNVLFKKTAYLDHARMRCELSQWQASDNLHTLYDIFTEWWWHEMQILLRLSRGSQPTLHPGWLSYFIEKCTHMTDRWMFYHRQSQHLYCPCGLCPQQCPPIIRLWAMDFEPEPEEVNDFLDVIGLSFEQACETRRSFMCVAPHIHGL